MPTRRDRAAAPALKSGPASNSAFAGRHFSAAILPRDFYDRPTLVVASGTPEQLAQVETSHTGRALRQVLAVGRSNAYAAR